MNDTELMAHELDRLRQGREDARDARASALETLELVSNELGQAQAEIVKLRGLVEALVEKVGQFHAVVDAEGRGAFEECDRGICRAAAALSAGSLSLSAADASAEGQTGRERRRCPLELEHTTHAWFDAGGCCGYDCPGRPSLSEARARSTQPSESEAAT